MVRVRFAPSPTGFLHVGGARVALLNWLFARQKKGQFLLRIEDTDLERSEACFTEDILKSLQWLGLKWDEEPLYQSRRLDLYRKKAEELIEKGFAYRCVCSEGLLEKMRETAIQQGKKPEYDRRCRELKNISKDQPHVIRAKIPQEGKVEFQDLVRGFISFDHSALDDFILVRSNGAPTYHLSVVVDDVLSQVTHVLRGEDHINNTPKHIHLYRFFDFSIPQFVHLPMILGTDKKKLSKRNGAVSTNAYRSEGYLPEALLNFLVRLGWSHGDQEVFTQDELVKFFSFENLQKSAAVFNPEKLLWLNGYYIRNTTPERLLGIILEDFSHCFTEEALMRLNTSLGVSLIRLIQPKVKLIKELVEQLIPLCSSKISDQINLEMLLSNEKERLPLFQEGVQELLHFLSQKQNDSSRTVGETETFFREFCNQRGIVLASFAKVIRVALTGSSVSASLFDLISLLPFDLVKKRLERLLQL